MCQHIFVNVPDGSLKCAGTWRNSNAKRAFSVASEHAFSEKARFSAVTDFSAIVWQIPTAHRAHAVVAKRQHGWAFYYVMYNHSWRPSTSENNFLSRNLAEPVADARLCCARAPAHRHVAPRRPGSELFTWRRLRCPKGSCIGKRGEGRWWVRSPANSRTSFSKGQKDYRKIGTGFR